MKTTSASDFRDNMKEYLDMVLQNHEALIVSRPKNQDVIILSLEDYEALQETSYLLSSTKNAVRLGESMKEWEEGKIIRKNIEDL